MKTRFLVCALALLAACGQPEQKQQAPAPTPPAPPHATAPAPQRLDEQTIIGTWSFDGSCASEDGMGLRADNTAFYEEWGTGTWRLNREDQIVLDLLRREPGVEDDPGAPVTLTIDVSGASDEALEVTINGDGEEPREATALRCS
jgi:hypothetical protein